MDIYPHLFVFRFLKQSFGIIRTIPVCAEALMQLPPIVSSQGAQTPEVESSIPFILPYR